MSEIATDVKADMREVGPWGQAIALSFRFLLVGVIAIAIGWLVSNIQQVSPDSQAVVLRLGTVERIHGPGLLLAWPKPIEEVVLIPGSARQIQLPIARFVDGSADNATIAALGYTPSSESRLNGGFLLTGDSSVVHLVAQVFYQITDPQAYMISAEHISPALQRLFIASTIGVLAKRNLDTVLVARPEIASRNIVASQREHLRSDLVNAVNSRLVALAESGAGLGIKVSRVDLVPSIPSDAKDAFDSVLVITQEAEQEIATARTNAEISMQEANQTKDRTMTNATAAAQEAVSDATASTASIAALAAGNIGMSRSMQLSRLYYDRIGPIVKKAGRVEVVAKDGSGRVISPGAKP